MHCKFLYVNFYMYYVLYYTIFVMGWRPRSEIKSYHITSSFTLILTPKPDPRADPHPRFFFEFSKLLNCFVHIHPDQPNRTPRPDPPPPRFSLNFLKNFNSLFRSTLTPPPTRPPPPPFFSSPEPKANR